VNDDKFDRHCLQTAQCSDRWKSPVSRYMQVLAVTSGTTEPLLVTEPDAAEVQVAKL
jgi:hypothetical protein